MPWLDFGRTAYADDSPAGIRTVAELRIYGVDLDPDEVSSTLGRRRAVAAAPDWRLPREELVLRLAAAGLRSEARDELRLLDRLAVIQAPDDPADAYFEEVVTGRSRASHQLWRDTVRGLLGIDRA